MGKEDDFSLFFELFGFVSGKVFDKFNVVFDFCGGSVG